MATQLILLADTISRAVTQLQEILDAKGLAEPSLEEDAPRSLPPEALQVQDAILNATAELRARVLDPVSTLIMNRGVSLNRNCIWLVFL